MKKKLNPKINLTVVNNAVQFRISEGWDAEFIGADFPQLVDDALQVHTPICDSEAVLSFRCKNGSNVIEKDCKLRIKGAYGASGKKPNILPEPAQWHAAGGVLQSIRTFACDSALRDAAADFVQDFALLTGVSLTESAHADLTFSADNRLVYLGEEGYEIECKDNRIHVKACAAVGAIWAGKTVCQLFAQGGFPNGILRDYPKYPVRGFMLDAGRKPVSMDTLREIVNTMSFYKMNDFQIHLSDNYIWLEDYAQHSEADTYNAYQAFRLESNLRNKNGESPTAKDYSYTKAEFREFIRWAKTKGVHITPEIDVPAHALAFTKVFPEFAVTGEVSSLMDKRPLTDHINIADPAAVAFVKRIFDEYIQGENPVFPEDTVVHIGADEFLSDYGAYRRFLNEIIPYLKKDRTVRLWGGLTWIKDTPETPIVREAIDGVQMNLWSCGWSDGREMYDLGYDLINTIDALTYIVPHGGKRRAPYCDYINKRKVFREFAPNRVRLKEKGRFVNLPAGSKQICGSCYAIWQDNIDKRCAGVKEQDLCDRFRDSVALFAEKNWGACTKRSSRQIDKTAKSVQSALKKPENRFSAQNGITLSGGHSFVNGSCAKLAPKARLELEIEFQEIIPGQILMEADAPYGTHDIRITENGKLGFTAENIEYVFDYTPAPNEKLHLIFETAPEKTVLKIGTFIKKKAVGRFAFDGTVRKSDIAYSSFCIPTQRIGSKTNAVRAQIYSVKAK